LEPVAAARPGGSAQLCAKPGWPGTAVISERPRGEQGIEDGAVVQGLEAGLDNHRSGWPKSLTEGIGIPFTGDKPIAARQARVKAQERRLASRTREPLAADHADAASRMLGEPRRIQIVQVPRHR
jgi:hypothetical protein